MGFAIGIGISEVFGSKVLDADALVDNLELETDDNFLLETGGFILLET